MTWAVMILFLMLAAVVQTQIPGWVMLAQAKVPVLLSLTVYYALRRPPSVMLACGFAAGLIQDFLSPMPMGSSAASFCVAGMILSRLRGVLQTDSALTQVFFGGVTAAAVMAVSGGLLLSTGMISCAWQWAALKVFFTGMLGAAAAPLVFQAAGWVDRLVGNVRGESGVEEEHAFT